MRTVLYWKAQCAMPYTRRRLMSWCVGIVWINLPYLTFQTLRYNIPILCLQLKFLLCPYFIIPQFETLCPLSYHAPPCPASTSNSTLPFPHSPPLLLHPPQIERETDRPQGVHIGCCPRLSASARTPSRQNPRAYQRQSPLKYSSHQRPVSYIPSSVRRNPQVPNSNIVEVRPGHRGEPSVNVVEVTPEGGSLHMRSRGVVLVVGPGEGGWEGVIDINYETYFGR
ncbi:hypothetical protein BGX38DRAFT_697449 [Terfezia claveryi]|nr:hypothetical protein BGX38DRAFT_697449 [Terfezia claveryi]